MIVTDITDVNRSKGLKLEILAYNYLVFTYAKFL